MRNIFITVFILLLAGSSLPTAAANRICAKLWSVQALPLEYAKNIADQGFKHVRIQEHNIQRVVRALANSTYQIRVAAWDMPPFPGPETSFNALFEYFLTLDSINYMYFHESTGNTFADGDKVGAGLVADRLTGDRYMLFQPTYLADLSLEDAELLFAAETPLPNLQLRVRHLRSVGRFLDAHRGVDWQTWVTQFPRAIDLSKYIAATIEGFDDPFLKRAQLFAGMLVGRFFNSSELPPNLRDLHGMTVYADYILPMVYYKMGIIDYAPELEAKIRAGELIPSGSREETEIRAATLIASQKLLEALNKSARYKNDPTNILALDAAIWLQGGEVVFPGSMMPDAVFLNRDIPHHRTLTHFY